MDPLLTSKESRMLKRILTALGVAAALTASPSLAQQTGVTITTFANLPATCVPAQPFVVSDANATCTGASGSSRWCLCNDAGNGYNADPGGTPGVDSVGTSELNDGSDTPLAGEWVQVDPGDTTRFNYRSDAELIADSGAAPLASPALTGSPTAPTPAVDSDSTAIATTAFVQAETLGGDVSGVIGATVVDDVQTATTNTETTGNSTTQVASTAFVQQEIRLAEDWDAFDFYVDGTRCKPPVGATINSGAPDEPAMMRWTGGPSGGVSIRRSFCTLVPDSSECAAPWGTTASHSGASECGSLSGPRTAPCPCNTKWIIASGGAGRRSRQPALSVHSAKGSTWTARLDSSLSSSMSPP